MRYFLIRRQSIRSFFCVSLLASLVAILVAIETPASASSRKGSSGSFTFSGEISAKLKVPAVLSPGDEPGCQISPSQGGTDVIVWDNVKITQYGKKKSISLVDLQLQVSKFGHTYSMKEGSDNSALGAVFLSTNEPYQWTSTSGTIATHTGGKSGSVTGVLSAGISHPGTVSVKGSWAGCTKSD
jgi:hypothetical protein